MDKELIEQVTIEATALIKNTTPEERKKLDFSTLEPQRIDRCVYGQMTGDCNTNRAVSLMVMCAKKVYTAIPSSRVVGILNGSPKGLNRDRYWSPIEIFIAKDENQNNGNNQMLINFLKGKRKTLNFK